MEHLPEQFRLPVAVGDCRHFNINTVAPRHFVQTVSRAGVGEEVVNSIIGELRNTGRTQSQERSDTFSHASNRSVIINTSRLSLPPQTHLALGR